MQARDHLLTVHLEQQAIKHCSPPRYLCSNPSFYNQPTLHNTTHTYQTTKQQSPCSSPPLSSPSPLALPSSWPRPTLPSAAAGSHSAASLMSLILLLSLARTVSVAHNLLTLDLLTIDTATGSPQTIDEFDAVCAGLGVTAQCCVLPIVSFCDRPILSCIDTDSITARPGPSLRVPVKRESIYWLDRSG